MSWPVVSLGNPGASALRELCMPWRFRQVCWHELPEQRLEDSYSPMTFDAQVTRIRRSGRLRRAVRVRRIKKVSATDTTPASQMQFEARKMASMGSCALNASSVPAGRQHLPLRPVHMQEIRQLQLQHAPPAEFVNALSVRLNLRV